MSRPAFAANFPDDPELDRLVTAFEHGDFAYVRQVSPLLAERTEDEDVRRAALELCDRTRPDPLTRVLLLGSVILLVVLSGWYWTHPH